MSLDSIFRLSVLINMVDQISGPMGGVNQSINAASNQVDNLNRQFGNLAKTGAGMTVAGTSITNAVTAPVESTYATKRALGELSSVGIRDLKAIEDAAVAFTNVYSGTLKPEFISASYDIKSGISSLSDVAVGGYTYLSALTAKATKSTVGEMTDLFATGHGIYKSYYADLSDLDFASLFSAGIARSVQMFKTTGAEMKSSISTLGKAATNANVPIEEQFAIFGMLQQTMSGSEAGTKYKAFLKSVVKAGDELNLTFLDANNQLLSMPEILVALRGKYGDTLDAVEKMQLQKAFGTEEAVAMIDLLYPKIGELESNVIDLHSALGQGSGVAEQMAAFMNADPGAEKDITGQMFHNLKEQLGGSLQPTMTFFNDLLQNSIMKMQAWVSEHPRATSVLMNLALGLGIVLTVLGTLLATIGLGGMVILNGLKNIKMLWAGMKILSIWFMKGFASVFVFTKGLLAMAFKGIVAAASALPGLIAGVWSFTAALLANPITWIVIGIMALVTALYLLWKHFDKVSSFVTGVFHGAMNLLGSAFDWVRSKLEGVPNSLLVVISAFNPFIGVPLFIMKNWEGLSEWFGGLWTRISAGFGGFIKSLPGRILESLTLFKESGRKIMETLGAGIKSAVSGPVDAVKGALGKIRKMLPFSDAKEGPLRSLTLNGRKVFETLAVGMELGAPSLIRQTQFAFANVNQAVEEGQVAPKAFGQTTIKKVNLREVIRREEHRTTQTVSSGGAGKTENHFHFNFEHVEDVNTIVEAYKTLRDDVEGL